MAISFKRSGVRYDKKHQDRTRQLIADAKVTPRLIKAFNGEIELTQSQVAIGLALLKKIVGDMQTQEITGDVTNYVARLPEPAATAEEWAASHKPTEARTATKAITSTPSAQKH